MSDRSLDRPSARQVFWQALKLGLASFGGPVAHIGYFERAYVQRLKWLEPGDFAGLVALCQMIPGPASSQLGYLIGLKRAGPAGALAAWAGFTLPSALIMFGFALAAPSLTGPWAEAAIHGLKLAAVAVVAQAVWSMGRKLCPDLPRLLLGLAAAGLILFADLHKGQLLVLLAGGVVGAVARLGSKDALGSVDLPVGAKTGVAALALFLLLLGVVEAASLGAGHDLVGLAAICYRAGALVFGGGHVVLPLLHDALVPQGWLSESRFLAGYGAAQTVPGPLFTFAAYIGAAAAPADLASEALWSAVALVAIFLPGLLIALAGAPLWNFVRGHVAARGALAGINAAVVGVLAAALYRPIGVSAIAGAYDLAIAAVGALLLERLKTPPLVVVALCLAAAVTEKVLE
jgi:chromate transporter